jgi:hypothetical protein
VDSNQHNQFGKTEASRDTQEALVEVLTSEIKQQQQHFLHSSTMVQEWVCVHAIAPYWSRLLKCC